MFFFEIGGKFALTPQGSSVRHIVDWFMHAISRTLQYLEISIIFLSPFNNTLKVIHGIWWGVAGRVKSFWMSHLCPHICCALKPNVKLRSQLNVSACARRLIKQTPAGQMLTHVSDRLIIILSIWGSAYSDCVQAELTVADVRLKSRVINLHVVLQAAATTTTSNSKNDISLSICSSSVMLSFASFSVCGCYLKVGETFTLCTSVVRYAQKSFCIAEQFLFFFFFLRKDTVQYSLSWKIWNILQFAS